MMNTSRRHFRIFVASSSDVQEERNRMPGVVDRLNRALGGSRGIHLELWRWEEDALPDLSSSGVQVLINPALDEANIVVFIVWNRIGPGTREEYTRAFERWEREGRPRVMVYECRRPALFTRQEQLKERAQVLDFLDATGKSALRRPYVQVDELERLVHDHLTQIAMVL